MRAVSAEYLANILPSTTARHIVVKATVDFTDPLTDQTITVTANEEATGSAKSQTADALTTPARKWAALDGSWALDGTFYLADGIAQMGWWGTSIAGVGGAFSAPYPKLTVEFAVRPIWSLKVVGDSLKGEYPVDFEIKLYDDEDTVLHTETVTGNAGVTWTEDIEDVADVTKITLEITKWSHAGRTVKILEFFTSIQETYLGDRITYLHFLEERDESQSGLSVGIVTANEIDIAFDNADGRFTVGNTDSPLNGLIKRNRRVRAWLGLVLPDESTEWIPLGVFWTGEWDTPEGHPVARTTARDRLELLRTSELGDGNVYTHAPYAATTLYALAEMILQDAGLTSTEYSVDIELQDFDVPYGYFEEGTSHREALRKVVEACMGAAYADRDGKITVWGPTALASGEPDQVITRAHYYPESRFVEDWSLANAVGAYSLPMLLEPDGEICRYNATIPAGETLTFLVPLPPGTKWVYNEDVSLESEDVATTITDASVFIGSVSVTIANAGAVDDTVVIVVSGEALTQGALELSYDQDADSVRDNGRASYTYPVNHLIQNATNADAVVQAVLTKYATPQRQVEMNWRGNPALELGDVVRVPEYGAATSDHWVVRQELTFDGSLEAMLYGRRIT